MTICLLPSSQLRPCKHSSRGDSAYRFLWQYLWIKLCIGMPKWICQPSWKCQHNLFAVWPMEWEPNQLYRYPYIEIDRVISRIIVWGILGTGQIAHSLKSLFKDRVFSRDVSEALLVYQNSESVIVVVYHTDPVGD